MVDVYIIYPVHLFHIFGVAPLLYYISRKPERAHNLKYLAIGQVSWFTSSLLIQQYKKANGQDE